MIAFQVGGTAAPKGSTRAFVRFQRGKGYRAQVTEDNPNTRPWAALVRDGAIVARGYNRAIAYPRPAAVRIELEFVLPRVQALPKRRIVPHTRKPDLDKLTRAVKDALTGVIWEDDAQVCAIVATKRYALIGEGPYCGIGVDAIAVAQAEAS